jgi:hypothetical protein
LVPLETTARTEPPEPTELPELPVLLVPRVWLVPPEQLEILE